LAALLRRPLSDRLQRPLRGLGIDLLLIAEAAWEAQA
jgi:hypothetical protein